MMIRRQAELNVPYAENDHADEARFDARNGPVFIMTWELIYGLAIQSDDEQGFKFGAAWRGS